MKRILSMIFLFSLVLGTTACSSSDKKESKTASEVDAIFEKEGYTAQFNENEDYAALIYTNDGEKATFDLLDSDGDKTYVYENSKGRYFIKDETKFYKDETLANSDFTCMFNSKNDKEIDDSECSKEDIKELKEVKKEYEKWLEKNNITTKDVIKHLNKVMKKEQKSASKKEKEEKKNPTFGTTVKFDGLEITFNEPVEYTTVDNQFSDRNGAEVVKVPVTVTNKGDKTGGLNMFYVSIYGAEGKKLDGITSYFDDDFTHVAGSDSLRPGASVTAFCYFLYDGNGDYYINFDNYSEEVEVKLPISK